MTLDMNQLRSFVAVTQTLNFTAAARQNGIPQSTVSRQVGELENQLGVKLFYRTRRDVQLTQEGRTFLPYAREMLEAEERGARAVQQLSAGGAGRLCIATVNTSTGFLCRCLRRFGRLYPDIVVDVTYVSCGDALQCEGEDPYDFHFLHRDMLPEGGDFDSLVTHSDRLVLVVPREHPLCGREPDGAALSGERFILVSEEESPILYARILDLCRSLRFTPRVINRYNSVKPVLLCVSAGLGISILPSAHAAELLPDALRTVPLPVPDTEIVYAMAWKRSLLNPAARLFLPVVRELAQA